MSQLLASVCFVVLVVGYVGAGRALQPDRRRLGWGSYVLLVLVAVPSLLQLLLPRLLEVLGRSAVEITQHHQYWRLVTSMVVQDGGVPGTAFNLVVLAVTVPLAERVWGSMPTVLVFLLGGLILNLLAVHLAYDGAGNSGATFGLGCTLLIPALLRRRGIVWALVAVLAAVGLLVLRDAHWVAAAFGVVLGPLLIIIRPATARSAGPRDP